MRPVSHSEESLVLKMQERDSQAMRMFYHLMAGYLTAVCARYIVQEDQIKDVLQESFIKIYTHIDRFTYQGEGSLRAWAARIVVNESLMALRSHSQQTLTYVADLPDIDDEDPDVEDIPPDVIQQFIRELPDGYRTVFNLYVFEDKTHQEIASLLHIKESSSASQLHRAKSMLAKKITAYKQQTNKRV